MTRQPAFPRTFFGRNLDALAREPQWADLPARLRRLWAGRLLLERCRFFRETVRPRRVAWGPAAGGCSGLESTSCAAEIAGYCDDCGGCCEIASGYPQFPHPERLPAAWRRTFADGLGRYHRFCAFLWERGGSGRSRCAIHPWRPQACRVFDQEECDWLRRDRAATEPPARDPGRTLAVVRRLRTGLIAAVGKVRGAGARFGKGGRRGGLLRGARLAPFYSFKQGITEESAWPS